MSWREDTGMREIWKWSGGSSKRSIFPVAQSPPGFGHRHCSGACSWSCLLVFYIVVSPGSVLDSLTFCSGLGVTDPKAEARKEALSNAGQTSAGWGLVRNLRVRESLCRRRLASHPGRPCCHCRMETQAFCNYFFWETEFFGESLDLKCLVLKHCWPDKAH